MKSVLKTGMRHESLRTIEASQTITFSGLPAVLATPFLVWILEETTMAMLEPLYEEDELTVGTQVDIEHLGAALVGDEVKLSATVVQASGRDFLFRVEAECNGKPIAKGLHRRKLVSLSKLRERLSR